VEIVMGITVPADANLAYREFTDRKRLPDRTMSPNTHGVGAPTTGPRTAPRQAACAWRKANAGRAFASM